MKVDFQKFLWILRYKLVIGSTPVSSVDELGVTFWYQSFLRMVLDSQFRSRIRGRISY